MINDQIYLLKKYIGLDRVYTIWKLCDNVFAQYTGKPFSNQPMNNQHLKHE